MHVHTTTGHRRRRAFALAASSVVLASLLAACSSSSDSDSDGSSAGDSGSAVTDADAFIKPYLATATKIPLTEPLKAAPEKGKTIVFLQCELAQCKNIGDFVKEATEIAGWNFKVIPYQSTNPSTLAKAMDDALRYDPVATAFTRPPFALWSQKVAEYKKAGVALIPSFTGKVPIDDTVIANPSSSEYAGLNGKILGNWFISDSKAKGNVLSVNTPDFPWLDDVSKNFDSTVAAGCPGCKVTKLNLGIPDIGSGASTNIVVSAIRKNPAVNYVVASNSAFVAALPAALKAAGLGGKVKVGGCCGGKVTETGLRTGDFSAITGVSGSYAGFITVDAALRFAEGSPVPENEGDMPVGLLVPGTDVPATDSYDYPADFKEQFKALW